MMTLDRTAAIALLDEVAGKLAVGSVDTAMDQLIVGLDQLRREWPWAEWRHFATVMAREHPLCRLIHEDPFTRRAFEKPRGYPGDAALLDYVYDGVNATAPLPATTSSLGRSLFTYTTATPTCRAVCARRDLLTLTVDAVASNVRNSRILAVAAGHLREVQQSQAFHDGAIGAWVALDQDATSLQIVCQADPAGAVIQTVTASIQDVLRKKVTLGTFDLIYAAGLYDYLVQPIARKLTHQLFAMLRPVGRLLLGNVVANMPGAAYMEAYMDWWLIYRDRDAMCDLTAALPANAVGSQRIFDEEQRQIMFLELTKAESASAVRYHERHPYAGCIPPQVPSV
jgi:extracellular factor (EF) 3-hydroxypalmitic acid methyl ester biosynthesis protein